MSELSTLARSMIKRHGDKLVQWENLRAILYALTRDLGDLSGREHLFANGMLNYFRMLEGLLHEYSPESRATLNIIDPTLEPFVRSLRDYERGRGFKPLALV